MVGSMTTRGTTDTVLVDTVHAGPETSWNQEASRAHAAVTAVLGGSGRVGEDPPPGRRPVAGDSALWDG